MVLPCDPIEPAESMVKLVPVIARLVLAESVVKEPASGVAPPITTLLSVPAVAGAMVTVPVPVGESVALAFAGVKVSAPPKVVIVLLVRVSAPARVARVPVVGRVTFVGAVTVSVVAKAPESVKAAARARAPAVTVSAVPPALTTTALLALPVRVGSLSKPATIDRNSARMTAEESAAPVEGTPLAV
jgi:hypothetical protein